MNYTNSESTVMNCAYNMLLHVQLITLNFRCLWTIQTSQIFDNNRHIGASTSMMEPLSWTNHNTIFLQNNQTKTIVILHQAYIPMYIYMKAQLIGAGFMELYLPKYRVYVLCNKAKITRTSTTCTVTRAGLSRWMKPHSGQYSGHECCWFNIIIINAHRSMIKHTSNIQALCIKHTHLA